MSDLNIIIPSKPRIIKEEAESGIFEIDGLYPGYGHTLGNSLRRIILSSLPGAAISSIKIAGVSHEFSTIDGIKEDVINILLNLKQVQLRINTDEPQTLRLKVKGVKSITAKDIEIPGQVEILNPEMHIAELTDKNAELDIEMEARQGLGYVPKEVLEKERVDIGTIVLDAIFTPIKRVNYQVENMRVGDRTDFNKLRIYIETDGTIAPKEALEKSIEIMVNQLKAIIGFKEDEKEVPAPTAEEVMAEAEDLDKKDEPDTEFLKTRIETLDLSVRTQNALTNANIRTIGGLARKREDDLLSIEGLGAKGVDEIKKALGNSNMTLRE